MWEPADMNAVPIPNEKIKARNAISILEVELRDARLRVVRLEAELCTRKAWIAPVRRASSDVLSLIFEFCAKNDWKSPLKLAAISKTWRTAVLASPRAWSFLNLIECCHRDTIQLFFSRSGQCPMHMPFRSKVPPTMFAGFTHRLQCLSLNTASLPHGAIFPNVWRLSLGFNMSSVPLSLISVAHFPALRSLFCRANVHNDIFHSLDVDSLRNTIPPIEQLAISIVKDPTWAAVLSACKDTLLSLELGVNYYYGGSAFPASNLTLPLCKTLDISCWSNAPDVRVPTLRTPLLQYYSEYQFGRDPEQLHTDTGRVVHLRTNQQPTDSAFPKLQVLEIDLQDPPLTIFLSNLLANKGAYPELERITYSSSENEFDEDEVEECRDLMMVVNASRKRPIVMNIVNYWADETPGGIKRECGVGMPCHDTYGSPLAENKSIHVV
ncbi:hypothetical protein M408DRAFT_23574 [Serendipita vermifera MAFF 305830]|uniref:F-box domain-containing protein n=1 Tax=Serendipita vermifera MAFF 305830 TaxID=933852 RepID=A0A0C2XHE8_SERVB|nr:hypothetical protein M408DRAFT_23574 [Serendipita vermifera MAFF 305830]